MRVSPPPDVIVELTSAWDGERSDDGRPRVPDDVLETLRHATVEHVWHVLAEHGYGAQFVGGWLQTHPGRTLVGRCVTCQFLPLRPDLDAVVRAAGERAGLPPAAGQNTWVVDSLRSGDVLVADLFGKVREGTMVGDRLGSAIAAHTGVGAVVEGGVRDLAGLVELPRPVNFFYRGTDPTPIEQVTLAGMNLPVRIGGVTVLPGDVALGTPAGVAFVPAHLAPLVADHSEETKLRDAFSKQRLAEGTYSTAEIDVSVWPESIEADFVAWRTAGARAG